MAIDLLVVVLLVSIIVRGRDIGLVRQLSAALGFAAGLAVGVLLQPQAMAYADTILSRALLSLVITLGSAIILMNIGELLGSHIKLRIQSRLPLNKLDAVLGAIGGGISLLVAVWLLAPMLSSLPSTGIQQSVKKSLVVGGLNSLLPSAPEFVSRIDRLINPNGIPDVFAGLERQPLDPDTPLPSLGDLQPAVQSARPSVVKLEGKGCGGIVDGSGFVAADGVVVTNAHVVAGVRNPVVIDTNGRHNATPIWFDDDLDLAVLRISDRTALAGEPLVINTVEQPQGTPAVALGYPGGGGFTASPATILDQFDARGRDIYGRDLTTRNIYEVRAAIIPGNSGGPMVGKDGRVIGLVFAESTAYEDIGYTLTMRSVAADLQQALQTNQPSGTGSCAE